MTNSPFGPPNSPFGPPESPFGPPEPRPWEAAPVWDGTATTVPPTAAGGVAPTTRATPRNVRRRPIMMTIAGLVGGFGVALRLVHFGRIAIGTNAPLVVIAIGGAVGLALAYTLPPRRRRAGRRQR